ncbi:hypothetical protein FHU35_15502 [Saccharopolyspora dendranthemae]|uniref:Uncharacterized protein n=1 Tax=Saccharopolyspora dendranthemae TaxID=1181886 RepID=A0A561U2R2_9PSEU|nr:hypothetical protein FHU35_15502 [Saccharopolyspora dendranthemae]
METPVAAKQDFVSLRSEMYEFGRGAWFSSSLQLEPPAHQEISYNYEELPDWRPPIPPMAFVQDLADFPRDDASVPHWLRAKIAEVSPVQGGTNL